VGLKGESKGGLGVLYSKQGELQWQHGRTVTAGPYRGRVLLE